MKLNLGSGKKRHEGFTNVDLNNADINCDIRKLPFENDSIEHIMAIHVCEHFYLHEIKNVLSEWHRVLMKGGVIEIELPCLDKVLRHFINGSPANMTMWALYGQPETHKDGEPSLHKWCYSIKQFRGILEAVGFIDVKDETPLFHQPSRDMRFVAHK